MENLTDQTTQQLMFSLIEIWHKGNQSQPEFCKERDINYQKFQYWFRKYRAIHSDSGKDTKFFKQIEVKNVVPRTSCPVEIVYPDGRKVIFHQPVDIAVQDVVHRRVTFGTHQKNLM